MTREELITAVHYGEHIGEVDLSGLDLSGAELSGGILERVQLRGTRLGNAALHETLFIDCNLENPSLHRIGSAASVVIDERQSGARPRPVNDIPLAAIGEPRWLTYV